MFMGSTFLTSLWLKCNNTLKTYFVVMLTGIGIQLHFPLIYLRFYVIKITR